LKLSDPFRWLVRPSNRGVVCCLVGDVNIQGRSDPRSALAHVRHTLAGADVLFGNLEGCLHHAGPNDIPNKPSWSHSDPSTIDALTSARFSVVGCANNVMFGERPTLDTLRILDEAGIAHCGAGIDRIAARAAAIVERRGVRFGFLQYTARVQAPQQAALVDRAGVATFDPDRAQDLQEIYEDVRAWRSRVDVLIVSHHLRRAGCTRPEPYQSELARGCVDAGADLVFGHGAHVNQGIETWKGASIFHCVGQLAFDWPLAREHRDGLLVRVVVEAGRIGCVTAVLVSRDGANNAYFVDPRVGDGKWQLDQLRHLSPDVPLPIAGGEVIVVPPNSSASR
jgi:poly-gamma-glutamate capsule biosynthesis protein CapA/YwtB (metallophosphatase superfamily)